ncbi:MAG: nucleotidyl transferase AbiEii/AbiGii toxin family protein [Nitrospirae bacterium]|nr:nucleotidyl transferase AbiEii/AbiGii toxin family protein [Nitrospirota bacterium]MDA1304977.1 nucleotidyl transferase AbiEii/AbiGii toxin family protein [Nitrospirota bacterium]
MDRVARLPAVERNALFSETAASKGTTPAVIEKDFWVTWVLDHLFRQPEIARLLMFKGGTSLSKVYRLIERFSEDIDLILDWRVLSGEDPLAERSRSSQERLNEAINEQARGYIGGDLLAHVSAALGEVCHCEIESANPHVINVRYPAAFSDTYLRPEVRLEIGPLASWLPHEERTIQCYAAEAFPRVFERKECSVRVIKAERTFWEKATILHHEAHRPEGSQQPPRYSRHYYDIAKMTESPVKNAALTNLELLADVVEFKERFYPRSWARYDLARPGSFRLVPKGHILAAVETDYQKMTNMIFGELPAIGEIMTILKKLQDEINEGRD